VDFTSVTFFVGCRVHKYSGVLYPKGATRLTKPKQNGGCPLGCALLVLLVFGLLVFVYFLEAHLLSRLLLRIRVDGLIRSQPAHEVPRSLLDLVILVDVPAAYPVELPAEKLQFAGLCHGL